MRSIFLCIVPLIMLSCSSHRIATLSPETELQLQEALFRYMFEHNHSGLQQSAPIYFISVGESSNAEYPDPNPSLLARFGQHVPTVKAASSARISDQPDDCALVRDSETGEQGLIFVIQSMRLKSADEVEALGGYYAACLSASSNRYTVKRKRNKWIVTKDKLLSIS